MCRSCRVFYPLTGVYTSYPLQDEVVNATAVLSIPDSTFMYASYCNRDAQSQIELPAVPYASAGAFSVNFWFKAENVTGAIMEYLYSQAGGHLDINEFGPSQVPASSRAMLFHPQQNEFTAPVIL